jgi:hypothetical protein
VLASLTPDKTTHDHTPELVLYVTAGDAASSGKVYQVDDTGRELGKVKMPYTATGIALHRNQGLVLAVPRDGGKIMRIDDTGKLSTIIEKDPAMPHPTDVGVAGESDTIVVGDDISNKLIATTTAGTKPKVYQSLQKSCSGGMSVAVTNDKHVLFSTAGEPGVFSFGGDQSASGNKPVLAGSGGVAADPKTLRWAAAQAPDQILVYEGPQCIKKFRLPPGKDFYRNGLLSFSPAGSLCVAVRDNEKGGEVWLLVYDVEKDKVRSLFPWKNEEMQDFTAGPRMYWERHSPSGYRSTF